MHFPRPQSAALPQPTHITGQGKLMTGVTMQRHKTGSKDGGRAACVQKLLSVILRFAGVVPPNSRPSRPLEAYHLQLHHHPSPSPTLSLKGNKWEMGTQNDKDKWRHPLSGRQQNACPGLREALSVPATSHKYHLGRERKHFYTCCYGSWTVLITGNSQSGPWLDGSSFFRPSSNFCFFPKHSFLYHCRSPSLGFSETVTGSPHPHMYREQLLHV